MDTATCLLSCCFSTIRIDRFEWILGSSSRPDRANRTRLTLFLLMIDMDFVQTIKNGQTKCEAENLVLAWQNPQLQAYPIRTRPSLPVKVTIVSYWMLINKAIKVLLLIWRFNRRIWNRAHLRPNSIQTSSP